MNIRWQLPVVAVIAGLVLATPAHADTVDAIYLRTLANHGITCSNLGMRCDFGPQQSLIAVGHLTCAEIDKGTSLGHIQNMMVSNSDGNLNNLNASELIGAAIGAYCDYDSYLVPGSN